MAHGKTLKLREITWSNHGRKTRSPYHVSTHGDFLRTSKRPNPRRRADKDRLYEMGRSYFYSQRRVELYLRENGITWRDVEETKTRKKIKTYKDAAMDCVKYVNTNMGYVQ